MAQVSLRPAFRTQHVADVDAANGIAMLWADLQEIHMRIKPDLDPTTPQARAAWERGRAAPVPVP